MHDNRAALNVTQEIQAKASALGGTRNKAGNISDRVTRVASGDNAEVRNQRRKRIVGNLRTSRTHGRDQRGLTRRRETDESHVRHGLQLQDDVAFLARLTQERESGGLASLRGQRRVAQAAATALSDHEARTSARQVGQQLARHRLHDRALGDRQDDIRTGLPLAEVTHARRSVVCAAVRAAVVVQQRGLLLTHLQDDRAAVAAVAAVGASQRLELFTLNRGNAITAVTACRVQRHAIHEVCHWCS